MLGSSREALATCRDFLDAQRDNSDFGSLAEQLYAVADLVGTEAVLRSALADSGQLSAVRENLAQDVFASRVSPLALELIRLAVVQRWSEDMDLVLALEQLAEQAVLTVAQNDGTLDATEEELFLFGRAVDSSAELQMALTDPASSADVKAAIVRDLVAARGTTAAATLLGYSISHLHGRRIDSVVSHLGEMAAQQRDRVVADVRVAAPLTPEQSQRLAQALSQLKGRTVRLNVAVDPSVLGGVHVSIGEEVIDGTIASRLEQARRALLG
jgi:F-type H+-transporting ATPase subunit delta